MAEINYKKSYSFPSMKMSEEEKDMFVNSKRNEVSNEALEFGREKAHSYVDIKDNHLQSFSINVEYVIFSPHEVDELRKAIESGDKDKAMKILNS